MNYTELDCKIITINYFCKHINIKCNFFINFSAQPKCKISTFSHPFLDLYISFYVNSKFQYKEEFRRFFIKLRTSAVSTHLSHRYGNVLSTKRQQIQSIHEISLEEVQLIIISLAILYIITILIIFIIEHLMQRFRTISNLYIP